MGEFYENEDATRALQASQQARQTNLDSMIRWGAYSLVKVCPRGAIRNTISNYVTNLPAISGKTPRQMEDVLGLRINQLSMGADVYRLLEIPAIDGFLPRGYSTLVQGLALKIGLKSDGAGYRPGFGAWQITLIKPINAIRIASLGPRDAFEPGPHPKYQVHVP